MKTKEKTFDDLQDFWQKQFETPLKNELAFETATLIKLNNEKSLEESSVGTDWIKFLKRTFLFLPGALLLFMSSEFIFYAFFVSKWDFVQILSASPWLLLYSFMVMFGLDSIKKPKDLFLPLSVIAISFLSFLIASAFGNSVNVLFYYSIYLSPLVLAIPILLKSFLNDGKNDK